jgi:hypothetical protein
MMGVEKTGKDGDRMVCLKNAGVQEALNWLSERPWDYDGIALAIRHRIQLQR